MTARFPIRLISSQEIGRELDRAKRWKSISSCIAKVGGATLFIGSLFVMAAAETASFELLLSTLLMGTPLAFTGLWLSVGAPKFW